MTRRPALGFTAALVAAFVLAPLGVSSAVAVPFSPTVLASTAADGTPANASSSHSDLSADGRYVVFESAASNLVADSAVKQIYRKDLLTGEILLVSAKSNGQAGTADSVDPSISDDGRYVAFSSASLNFGARDVLIPQVFVRDLAPGGSGLTMISRNPATGQPGDGGSSQVAISGSGSHVVFLSAARDLVPGVPGHIVQVYEADLTTGATPPIILVSRQDATQFPAREGSDAQPNLPAVSADGGVVVFMAAASNLTADETFDTAQVWVHEVATGRTTLVSERATGGGVNSAAWTGGISADGRRVVFWSDAEVIAGVGRGMNHVYVRDLPTGATTLVDTARSGVPSSSSLGASSADISADGRVVVFKSTASDLGPEKGGGEQTFRAVLSSGAITLVSSRGDAVRSGGDRRSYPRGISADGSVVAMVSAATDLTSDTLGGTEQVFVRRIAAPAVDRIGGADRYAVSAGVSGDTFGPAREVAYVASGAGFADALSASAAAGVQGGPVLLVAKDSIPTGVTDELARLHPAKIVLTGGPDSVSPEVERALAASAPVTRIGGADRFEVSARVSRSQFASATTVYLASGAVFPDALSGAAATRGRAPVLLVTRDAVPATVQAELARLAPARIVVLGGANTISDALVAALPRSAAVTRIGGVDRYALSAAISAGTFTPGVETVYVASGAVFPDALSGSAAAIAEHSPVLLVTKESVPNAVAAELRRLGPRRIVLLGGPATVSDAVQAQLVAYLSAA